MNPLHFVVVGTHVTAAKDRILPTIDQVSDAVKAAADGGYELNLHLIDPSLDESIRQIPFKGKEIEAKLVKSYDEHVKLWPISYANWLKKTDPIKPKSGEATIYQLNRYPTPLNREMDSYRMMGLLSLTNGEDKAFIVGISKPPDLKQQIEDFIRLKTQNLMSSGDVVKSSDFYGGKAAEGKLHPIESKAIQGLFIDTARVIQAYLNAGYHQGRIGQIKENWMMNSESLPMKGFIYYYQLFPEVADRDPQLEMLESGDYRRRLLNLMIQSVSNYVINSELMTIQQIKDVGGWMDIKLWNAIEKNAGGTPITYTPQPLPPPKSALNRVSTETPKTPSRIAPPPAKVSTKRIAPKAPAKRVPPTAAQSEESQEVEEIESQPKASGPRRVLPPRQTST